MNAREREMFANIFGARALRHERRIMKGMRAETRMPFARPVKVWKKFIERPTHIDLIEAWIDEGERGAL